MSQWGALWALDSPVKTTAVNPQGVLAAPVGTIAVRPCDGAMFMKRGGGSTAFGWYLLPSDTDPRCVNVSGQFAAGAQINAGYNPNALPWAGNTNINIVTRPALSGSNAYFPNDRMWTSGFTSVALNNIGLWRTTGTVDAGFPYNCIGGAGLGLDEQMEWDFSIDICTTPRDNPAGSGTTLAEMRAWVALLSQNNVIQLSGGMGTSDLLYTAFPSSLVLGGSLYGAAFRFSTVAGDTQWAAVTANDNGVAAQTVTPVGPVVLADSVYRLRLRFVVVAGVPTIFASVDDGTETTITANVGTRVSPAAKVNMPLLPYVSIQNLNGGGLRKSLGWSRLCLTWGKGCS